MLIIPAIDIKGGKVVRLMQGKYREETIYSDDPVSVARNWVSLGASLIHIVDLDGALYGKIKNIDAVKKIAETIEVPIQFGGGIRRREDVKAILSRGIAKVILGTKACEEENFVREVIKDFGERIIVSIDARRKKVLTSGWTVTTELKPITLAKKMENLGIKTIIYTDTSRDGTLMGPNIEGLKEILDSVKICVISSGGVASLDDIRRLRSLEPRGLWGIIIGKALYEGKIDLGEAIELTK